MTSEKRLIIGIEDIKSISLECNGCKVRLTYDLNTIGKIPNNCPNPNCNVEWHAADIYAAQESKRPVLLKLISAIAEIRHRQLNSDAEKAHKEIGFRVLLELDEPK